MYRRRLAAFAGAIGLLGALFSSGVAAQADTLVAIDSTMSSLISTYLSSGKDACVGGTSSYNSITQTTTCTITQPLPGDKHIAVCVQSNSAGPSQVCSITQDNAAQNNYALVIQHIEQSQGATQPAQQSVSIKQTNGSGSNFSRVFQTVNQSTHDQDGAGYQTQKNMQHVEANPFVSDGPGLSQMATSGGSNFAEVTQDSRQSGKNAPFATQTADQFAGNSRTFPGNGIDQSAPLGKNVAALFHTQQQQLDNSTSQTQTATQDADITQDGSLGTNQASGTQLQDQQEHGGGVQKQTGGPRCCSLQNGGDFFVTIKTNQQADNISPGNQIEFIEGNCDSPGGTCHTDLSATQQNVTTGPTPATCQTSSICHQTILLGNVG
jgi:hypothetical protein